MSAKTFWSRVRNARLYRVFAIYLVASWAILQIVELFIDSLGLPTWAMPAAVVLLLIGLVIVVATAWVQSPQSTKARPTDVEAGSGAWAVDLGEIRESMASGRLPRLNWARVLLVGVVAFSLLFGAAGVYVLIQDRGESFAPTPAIAETASPGIAVLPFSAQGDDPDVWQEGMVSLLSAGLDGVAGLRAISGRTVLARWDEAVADGEMADLETALQVARSTDARYALVGSAVARPSAMRLSVEIYDIEDGALLGNARVEGPPDSVLALGDRLGVEVLRIILQRGERNIPRIDLTSLTTDSPEALKAFLEGEVYFRRLDFAAAEESYRRALAADSMFALAHARLALTYGWWGRGGPVILRRHLERAAQLADRLPDMEAVWVHAQLSTLRGLPDAREALLEASETHPDAALVWYELADSYFHVPGTMATADEIEAVFERAAAIDPGHGRFGPHLVDLAFRLHGDSGKVARTLDARATEVETVLDLAARFAQALAFGDSASRASAIAAVDTLSPTFLAAVASRNLYHPRYWNDLELLLRTSHQACEMLAATAPGAEACDHDPQSYAASVESPAWLLTQLALLSAVWKGQVDATLALLGEPGLPSASKARIYYLLAMHDLGAPDQETGAALSARAVETEDPTTVFYAGAYAADQGRWTDHTDLIARLGLLASVALAAADSVQARRVDALAAGLEGYGTWRSGRPEAAIALLEDAQWTEWVIQWWLAELYRELGRPSDALQVYNSFYVGRAMQMEPLAQLEAAKLYEGRGQDAEAREAYAYFIEHWSDADPSLQPLVDDARQAVDRLGG